MKLSKIPHLLIGSLILLVGCQNVGVSEATAQSQPQAAVAVDEQVLKRGKLMFLQCRSCHSLEEGGAHQTGPNLHGLFGATVGTKDGFVYSETMTESNITWSAETLDEFLTKPTEFFPGTKMAYVGMQKDTDRQALIAYLQQMTQ